MTSLGAAPSPTARRPNTGWPSATVIVVPGPSAPAALTALRCWTQLFSEQTPAITSTLRVAHV
jgi:hypothetical protein